MTFTGRGPLARPLRLMKEGPDETAARRDISRIFTAFLLNLEDRLDTEATSTAATQTSKRVARLSILFGNLLEYLKLIGLNVLDFLCHNRLPLLFVPRGAPKYHRAGLGGICSKPRRRRKTQPDRLLQDSVASQPLIKQISALCFTHSRRRVCV